MSSPSATNEPIYRVVLGYVGGPSATLRAVDPTARLKKNDPVFFQSDAGVWSQIGYVRSVESVPESASTTTGPSIPTVTIAWHPRDPSSANCQLIQYRSSGRLEDIVALMLPGDQRARIADQIGAAMADHGEQLSAAYVPLVQQTLQKSLPVIEEEFRLSVARHRIEMDAILSRWKEQILEKRLVPLARREIIPIVRTHAEPQVEQIGRELWDKASLWRFAWRAMYDRSPLPKQDLVQDEWDRFVEEQAIPVFEAHMDDIVVAVQRIITDVAANDQVRAELSGVAGEIAVDPETRDLVRKILKETFVDNDRLRTVWTEVWTSDEARRAFAMTSDRLEPVVRKIGDEMFGTRENGINPNFARLLRNQILGKDRRWIVAVPTNAISSTSNPVITASDEAMPYPMVYMADEKESQ